MENKENDKNSLGYRMGQVLGVILTGCFICLSVALTVKFISWLF